VVGGGVFGACVAYELAKAGCRVVIVERDAIGEHASGKNPGNLNPILAAPARLQPLALASFRLHQALQEELAALGCSDYRVEPVRRVLVGYAADELMALQPLQQQFAAQPGFSAHWLDAAALRGIDARLAPDIVGGLLLEGNRSLDARSFNRAVLEGAEKYGARLLRAEVRDIRRRGDGYAVDAGGTLLDCDVLVLATGPWVSGVAQWLGAALPVQPVKGEMLRVRLPGANITHDFTHELISLYRRGEDEVWIGVTREACGFDEQPSLAGRQALLEGAMRIMPGIGQAEVVAHLASLRPQAPGGLPLLGRVPGHANLYVANGGGIKGMLLSPGIGRAIRDLVQDGRTALPIDEFLLQGV